MKNSYKVGIVWKIDELYKKVLIICISKGSFNQVVFINLKEIDFKLELYQLLFIDDSNLLNKKQVKQFFINRHYNLIDLESLKKTCDLKLSNKITLKEIMNLNNIKINFNNIDLKENSIQIQENIDKVYCGICTSITHYNNKFRVISISKGSYGEYLEFNLHEVPFSFVEKELIIIEASNLNKRSGIFQFSKFLSLTHSNLIDFERIKENNYVNVKVNKREALYFIKKGIASGDILINQLRNLEEIINHAKNSNYDSLLKFKKIEEVANEYSINYDEFAKTKIGDWGYGSIKIITKRSNVNDIYLDKLFPVYEKVLNKESEDLDTPFRYNIIDKMRNNIGEENVSKYTKLCEETTYCIRDFAILMYDKYKHYNTIVNYKNELEEKLFNKYK